MKKNKVLYSLLICLLVLGSGLYLLGCSVGSVDSGASSSSGTSGTTAQTWTLWTTMGGGPLQTAVVTVPAGVTGSTFTKISGEWYFLDTASNRVPLNVGGTISGSNWRFVGLTGTGGVLRAPGRT